MKHLKLNLLALLSFIYLLNPSQLYARDGINTAWKVGFSGPIYQRVSFLVEEDLRMQQDFGGVEWSFTTAEIRYKPLKFLTIGTAYMFIDKLDKGGEKRHRYLFYATATKKIGAFRFSVRERFQSTFKENSQTPSNFFRSMLTVAYNINNLDVSPFVYAETFNNTLKGKHFSLDRIRLSCGFDYVLNKHSTFQLYYRYHIFEAPDPVNYKNAIGVGYTYKL